jgi:cation transport regulator
MPYASVNDLPPEVKKLPENAQRIFMSAFNSAFKKYRTDEKAFKIAWSAVKQVFEKTENGWEKKKSFDHSMVFSKSFDSFKSESSDDFYVEGYIETPGMDILGDVCTPECLKDINTQLAEAVVMAKIGREHEHSLVDRNIMHVAKIIHHEVDENGVFIKAKLNKYHPDFESVKGAIVDGIYDSFSIEYFPEQWKDDVINPDGTYIPRRLDKITLTGVTFTGKPVNHEAVITNFGEGLIKSQAIFEVMNERNKSLNQEENIMTEKKEEVKAEPVKEEIKSVAPAVAVKAPEEVKSEPAVVKEEVKSTTESEEVKALKEEVKALKEKLTEEIKSAVIEELKSIQPMQKNLVDTSEQKFAKEQIKSDIVSQVTRQLGYNGE